MSTPTARVIATGMRTITAAIMIMAIVMTITTSTRIVMNIWR
jgi:hypothetical protein